MDLDFWELMQLENGAKVSYDSVTGEVLDPELVEEGKKLAIKCVNAAVQRDIASGNGIDVIAITKGGTDQVFAEKFNTRIEA